MIPSTSSTVRRATFLVVALTVLVSACGEPDAPVSGADKAGKAVTNSYPPSAAAGLSLGSGPGLADGDPYEIAADCAAAITLTSNVLQNQSSALPAGARDALLRAQRTYRDKAIASAPERMTQAQALNDIEERVDLGRGSTATQVQAAMACIRELS